MCEAPRRGAKTLIALSVALASLLQTQPLAAWQTVPLQSADELRARLDEIRPRREAAREAALAREARDAALRRSAAAAAATVDTIRVGMMTIVAPMDQVELARELFTEVWEEDFSHIDFSEGLEQAWFSFQWSERRVPIHLEEDPRPIELDSRWIRRSSAKVAIGRSIASTINFDLSASATAVGRWVSGNALLAPAYPDVYRMVATAESRSTRACLDGVIEECISGLGLTMPSLRLTVEQSDDAGRNEALSRYSSARREHLAHWYTPDERRSMVARRMERRPTRDSQGLWLRCVERGETAACDDLLLQSSSDQAPLGGSVRESFMAYAIAQGGSGAWQRLLDDPGMTPIEALEHASSRPIEDLATHWLDDVMAHRPDTFANLLPRSGLAVFWCLFFSAFAMRNTRWRMG